MRGRRGGFVLSSTEHVILVKKSGIFDSDYYRSFAVDLDGYTDEVHHYLEKGFLNGWDPCLYFSSLWYLDQNRDVKESGLNPLIHYILFGDGEDRSPSPLFDVKWYKKNYNIGQDINGLSHYMQYKKIRIYNPNPHFDVKYYLDSTQEAGNPAVDPFEHFLAIGCFQGKHPAAHVDLSSFLVSGNETDQRHPFLRFLGLSWTRPNPGGVFIDASTSGPDHTRSSEPDEKNDRLRAIVDPEFYMSYYADVPHGALEAVDHYLATGLDERRQPNLFLDPKWYQQTYLKGENETVNPVIHYTEEGEVAGFRPGPFFDPLWYRENYGIASEIGCLAHYLQNRKSYLFNPIKEFDVEYYIENNMDVKAAEVDAFEHFLFTGYKEGRNPSPEFQIKYYVNKYLGGDLSTHPFVHYLVNKGDGKHHGIPPPDEVSIAREIRRYSQKGPDFEEVHPIALGKQLRAKVLAYYLPQFHSFPENDGWWGKGFTEWTNIPRGISRFRGHYQPRIPRDLGYYSLDNTDIVRRQIDLARGAGVHGFVYYYYWFNGKRLMEKPVELFLDDPSLDMPFCLMWANENWTRRWDGAESEVLISQDYAPEDDVRLVDDFARHFKDSRYIRLNGRALLMVYRPRLVPDSSATIARWRRLFAERHGEEPILIMAQSFNDNDPRKFGLDGAIEFPPHKLTSHLPSIHPELEYLDDEFSGRVYRYEDLVNISVQEAVNDYPLIKTAVPSWDNDARRQGTGLVVTGSTPRKYQAWLEQLIRYAQDRPFYGHQIVCVNAWNEWCEAAYLEPDLHFGGAYLNATARAVTGMTAETTCYPILLVGHDAFPSGAQHLLLNIARRLKAAHGVTVEIVLLGGGALEENYRAVAKTHVVSEAKDLSNLLKTLRDRGFQHAILNSLASSVAFPSLRENGIKAINLIHELPSIITTMGLQSSARDTLSYAETLIFATERVRDEFYRIIDEQVSEKAAILPQGCYKRLAPNEAAGQIIRDELGIDHDQSVIIGVGYADLRKGFDLFLQFWRDLHNIYSRPAHAIWVGSIDPLMNSRFAKEIAQAKATGRFHMPGYRDDIEPFLNAADVFVLSSREDPFPTVVQEALSVGLPVCAFANAGGMSDYLVEHQLGTVVPHGDTHALALAVNCYLDQPFTESDKKRLIEFSHKNFNFDNYVSNILEIAVPQVPKISVAVLNYNYAHFMEQRLSSIFNQTIPVQEIIVLDDFSEDDSLHIISDIEHRWEREVMLVTNETNTGSAFSQWRKAAEQATGEFLWIAEADDDAEPQLLEKLAWMLQQDGNIQFAFCDSRSIDKEGKQVWGSYKDYYATVEPEALTQDGVYEGRDFIASYLSVKNLILNVSAVLWRRTALISALQACSSELSIFKLAGDWRLYLEVLQMEGAKVAYSSACLNIHRRHNNSITNSINLKKKLEEIKMCHKFILNINEYDDRLLEKQLSYIDSIIINSQ